MERIKSREEWEAKVVDTVRCVVKLSRPNCTGCEVMENIVARVAENSLVTFYEIDTDECPWAAGLLGLRSVPALAFFYEGKPMSIMLGVQPQSVVQERVHQLVWRE